MSLISDHMRRATMALDNAVAIGMPLEEAGRWRRVLDPATRDLCGCRAGILAFIAVIAFGLILQIVIGFDLARMGMSIGVSILAATFAKFVQSARAETRFNTDLELLAAASRRYRPLESAIDNA